MRDRSPAAPSPLGRAAGLGVAAAAGLVVGVLIGRAPEQPREHPGAQAPGVHAEPGPADTMPTQARAAELAGIPSSPDPPQIGQSIGAPRAGALFGGARLPPGDGYLLRHPARTFGTLETVAHLQRAIAATRTAYPKLHPLLVGDLSAELGGMLLGHRSHQSGRDVDLGLFYRRRPDGYPERFTDATAENLHLRGSLALIEALADTADQQGGVQWILLDYGIQKLLRRFGEREGMSSEALDRLFQFPHGPTAPRGLVRHFPGHRSHLHVRFACPPADPFCQSPAGPPAPRAGSEPLAHAPRAATSTGR